MAYIDKGRTKLKDEVRLLASKELCLYLVDGINNEPNVSSGDLAAI